MVRVCLLGLLLMLTHCQRVLSALVIVPDDHSTIQEAINVVIDADSVFVRAGTYREIIDMQGKEILLRAIDNRDSTIIIGRFIIDSGEQEQCIIDGFSLVCDTTYSFHYGIDIRNGSNPTISNLNIVGFRTVFEVRNSSAIIRHCDFHTNPFSFNGILMYVMNSTINFHDNIVRDNRIDFAVIYIWIGYSVVNLTNNLFVNNYTNIPDVENFIVTSANVPCLVNSQGNIFYSNEVFSCYGRVDYVSACNVSYENSWDIRQESCPDGDDFCQDPHICLDVQTGYQLNTTSPCLPENRPPDACGIIGPLTMGCDRPVPVLSEPLPAPDAPAWPEVYGTVGATFACATGIEAASLALRVDANGDGDYLDGGAEDWMPVPGFSDAPVIQARANVRFPRSGSYHWEVKGRDVVSGWWVYSGAEGRQGLGDDWTVTINRLPRTWHLPQDVADLFAARDSLQDGDTLRLAPGTWAGGVDFGAVNVALIGEGAPEEVIIQAPAGEGNVLHFRTSPVPGSCWMQNLTLQGGNGGVAANTTLFARNCRLPEGSMGSTLLDARGCSARGGFAGTGGIVLYECEHANGADWWSAREAEREDVQPGVAWVARCVFRDNWIGGLSGFGAGLRLGSGLQGLVANCVFQDNSIDAWGENGNTPQAGGAGLKAYGSVDAVGNLFVNNGVIVGGDPGFANGGAASIGGAFVGNTVVDCWAQGLTWPEAPRGIVSAAEVRDNLFVSNTGDGNECDASSCNLYWQNLDAWGQQPWTLGNCGVDEGGELWADPLFTDPANGDYRLLPGSPAWTPNHQQEAPGCGMLGAYGLSAPQLGPVEILGLQLLNNPLRTRLDLRCDGQGQTLHVYGAQDADGSYLELTSLAATDSLLSVDLPLGNLMPERRFYRVTQDEPGTATLGSWRWSLPAGQRALPEPPLVTELDRLRKAGLPWKPALR